MGFFTDLKEDLATAVNELMPEETEEAIRSQDETKESYEHEEDNIISEDEQVTADEFGLDKMLDNLNEADWAEELAEEIQEDTQEAADELSDTTEQEEQKIQDNEVEFKMDNMANRTVSDETAVITQGMVITGDIISEGSMDVIGSVIGNIEILGKLNITGSIQGNSKASEIFADNAKITGEVVSEGSVKIGQSSVIIGNISATSAVIAGAVKGDIDVQGPVILDTSAIVMGNIKSKSVQINNGAVIEGMCSQCYAEVNPTSFFDELKKNK